MERITRWVKSCLTLGLALFVLPNLGFAQHYIQTNLVTDAATTATATTIDLNLKNPWGLARSATSPWWVADNNAGVTTIYTGAGVLEKIGGNAAIKIPGPNGSPADFVSAPDGAVFNGVSTAFGGAHFIFVTEDGTISAWSGGASATLEVDNSVNPTAADGAVYKGATIAEFEGNFYLYATNFRSGHVEVYDTNFHPVTLPRSDPDPFDQFFDWVLGNIFGRPFEDPAIPRGFAPFNVQNIGGSLFVTYAKQDQSKHDNVAGAGLGFVDIYSPGGRLEARLQSGPWLNAPWGAVWAPRDFGVFSNRVLIGNFGSGQIAVFDGFDGKFIQMMEDTNGNTLTIDGLWALVFGNGGSAGPYNSLFFSAGPNAENNGLFGTLTPITSELGGDSE